MKRTKILATLGPATSSREVIRSLHEAGANAFRVNMSHGDPKQWEELINNVRAVAPGAPIVADTRGPEVRILNVNSPIKLHVDDLFVFALSPEDNMPHISCRIPLEAGQRVLFDDGAISTMVRGVSGNHVTVLVENDGELTNKRKVTVPDKMLSLPVIDEDDRKTLEFMRKMDVEVIALSFTQSADDVVKVRTIMGEAVQIIAKIENRSGVDNYRQIVGAADGVMVARGDLGVEIPLEEVPVVQKQIIQECNTHGAPAIVATQMLESMTKANRPTRAEVSDVANAILDGADVVMLSAETAVGLYPVQTVRIMARIAAAADREVVLTHHLDPQEKMSIDEAISNAVFELSQDIEAQAIVTATTSGFTARKVSRLRPGIPIVAVTHDPRVAKQLEMSWGVIPCLFPDHGDIGEMIIVEAVRTGLDKGLLQESDTIIATAGVNTMQKGTTNLIEVHKIKDLLQYHSNR